MARRDFPPKNSETLTLDWFGVYTAWVKIWASLEVFWKKVEQASIDPVENSVVAALWNTHGQASNTTRVKFQYHPF